MREVRLFGTRAELMHDYEVYPRLHHADQVKLRGKFITLVNEELDAKVYWLCEEDHDIRQAIAGLEISHLFMAHTITRETMDWAIRRVRHPYPPCNECGLSGVHKMSCDTRYS